MSAPLPTIRVDGPALIQRFRDEGVIIVEPLRIIPFSSPRDRKLVERHYVHPSVREHAA